MCLSQALPIAADIGSVVSGNPELMLAAAATTAGNYMQTQANNQSLDAQYAARNAAVQNTVNQEDQLSGQANNIVNNTANTFTPQAQDQSVGDLITNRQNAIAANTTTPSSFVDPTANANAPQVVQNSLADKMAQASRFAAQQGNALGTLGGLTDQNTQNAINLQNSGQQVGQIGNIAKGVATAGQAEANAAYNNARQAPSSIGEALSGVGTLLGLDGATGTTNINGFLGGNSNVPVGQVVQPGGNGMTNAENAFLTKTQQGAPLPWLSS